MKFYAFGRIGILALNGQWSLAQMAPTITNLKQQQQKQPRPSLSPNILGLAMDPQ